MSAHRRASTALKPDPTAGQFELPALVARTHVLLSAASRAGKRRIHPGSRPPGGRGVHDLGQVEGDHRHPGVQRRVDVPDVLQVITVGAVAALESLLEDEERGVRDDSGKIAVSQGQLADRLLREHRRRLVPSQGADVTGRGQPKPVAAADGRARSVAAKPAP